jgi:glycosyltransferase involved in cell wall biosynthesis
MADASDDAAAHQPAAPDGMIGSTMLWVVRGSEGYGVRRATLGMAAELRARGIRQSVASLQRGELADDFAAHGFDVSVLGLERVDRVEGDRLSYAASMFRAMTQLMSARARLLALVRRLNPDWIHIRMNPLLPLVAVVARQAGKPAYWHLPNTIASDRLGLRAIVYQAACRLGGVRPLANSRHTARTLGNALVDVRVLYPGIDEQFFDPAHGSGEVNRASLGLSDVDSVFLIMSRVVPAKAQDRVVEAAIRLRQAGGSLVLLVVGGPVDTPYFASLAALVRRHDAEASVRLLGPVGDPRAYYGVCDVVINGRTGPEPFGLTIVEAMMMERPVLAYRAGGPGETVVDGETGWLVDDPSADGYYAGMRRALDDRPRWRAMGQAARRTAIARYSVARSTEQYLQYVHDDSVSR